ncbi:MAG: hypothetical protein IKV61_00935 [Clostridia bacterium]|nr:hypothetical protein [Clostridia bacterium]
MYFLTKNKTKQFLVVLLALLMAITMAFATACSKDNDDDGDDSGSGGSGNTETTLTDYQVLKNGDFEFMTDEDTVFPKSSSIAWSNSLDSGLNGNTAPSTSSNGKSGIIDTLDDGTNASPYGKLDSNYKPKKEENGTSVSINPHTPDYYGLVKNKFVKDEADAKYEDNKTNANTEGSKILMIQNKTSNENVKGTAQKFKSSTSLAVNADSYAVFSVWVKTIDLASTFTDTPGAYVAIDFKVGSITYDTIYFNNINTKGEWALLQAKIQGFEYASTTAYVTLGLGKGNALGKTGYVEGFAYFDNAHFEVFNKQDFDASSDEVINVEKENNSAIDMSSKTYKANPTEKTEYADSNLDKFSTFTYSLNLRKTDSLGAPSKINGKVEFNTSDDYNNKNEIAKNANIGTATKATVPDSLKDKVADIEKIGGNDATDVIYFDFNKLTSATYLSDAIALAENSYNMITFYVKSNAVRLNSDKVKIDIIDYVTDEKQNTNAAFASFTTQDEEENNYGKWVKYTVMVDNLTDKPANYKIKISFGPNKADIKNDALFLQSGYAVIADLKAFAIDKDLYELSTADATLVKVSLKGEYGAYGEEAEEGGDDVYNTNVDGLGKYEIVTKPTTNLSDFTRKDCGDDILTGVINSKYNANYTGINNLDTFAKLTSNDNKYAQAVVLQSNNPTNSALVSSAKSLTANSFVKIAVKLNVSEGATARIYLSTSEIDDVGNYKVLSIAPTGNYTWEAQELSAVVKGSNSQTWTEVAFYIASGNEAINYKVEVWLGDRNNSEETKSSGTIFMENVIVSEYDETAYLYAKDVFVDTYGPNSGYENADDPYKAYKHTRAPSTVKETVDGEEVSSTRYYNEREIYNGINNIKFIDYTTLFAETEIDNTEETEDTETETEEEEEGYVVKTDVALQISSIVISVVLIAVMIIVLIRTIVRNRGKRKEYVSSFYNRNSREKTMKKINAMKTNVVLDEEENVEYNYEEAAAVEEEAVIDVDAINQNPEDLQEDGGSEDATNEETVEEAVEANEEPTNE